MPTSISSESWESKRVPYPPAASRDPRRPPSRDRFGCNVLHYIVMTGSSQAAELAIKHGAKANVK